MKTNYNEKLGFLSSISASALFALATLYVQILKPLSGFVIAGQRIIWTSLAMIVCLLIVGQFKKTVRPLTNPAALPGLILGSLLIGLQWGLFVWAPVNGKTLDLSLGYFLAPIVMVFVGRIFLSEKLYTMQWGAVLLASVGIIYTFYSSGGFSWVTLLVALGYPAYFLLRRFQALPPISAFFIENLLLVPLAIGGCIYFSHGIQPFDYSGQMLLAFLGLALLGSAGMICLLTASRQLPISLFGLLGYLEPVLIFLVAICFLGESVLKSELLTYILIVAALGLLAVDKMYRYSASIKKHDIHT
ncbi:MAG: chloramphenicol-sensitive protein RarD [Desulforhopalus sp.]|jgi:chloramphenicol-sensitive protein RarD